MNNTLSLNPPISITRNLILKRKLSLKFFWILSISLTIFLLVFYIFQINSIIQNTYIIQGYHEKVKELSEENKKLELSLTELNSLENLGSLVENLNYEKVDKIRYIQVLGGQIVTK